MSKCVGNCAICRLEVDKMACCMVQLLRNMIEVKKMLRERGNTETCDVFKGLEEIESEETTDSGLDVPGTAEGGETIK